MGYLQRRLQQDHLYFKLTKLQLIKTISNISKMISKLPNCQNELAPESEMRTFVFGTKKWWIIIFQISIRQNDISRAKNYFKLFQIYFLTLEKTSELLKINLWKNYVAGGTAGHLRTDKCGTVGNSFSYSILGKYLYIFQNLRTWNDRVRHAGSGKRTNGQTTLHTAPGTSTWQVFSFSQRSTVPSTDMSSSDVMWIWN